MKGFIELSAGEGREENVLLNVEAIMLVCPDDERKGSLITLSDGSGMRMYADESYDELVRRITEATGTGPSPVPMNIATYEQKREHFLRDLANGGAMTAHQMEWTRRIMDNHFQPK